MLKEKEIDIKQRKDRIGRYFKKYLDQFVFDEFSPAYMEKAGMTEVMKGVPIPLRKEELEKFGENAGLSALRLGENMIWVMGCDPHFKYTSSYIQFLNKVFNDKVYEGIVREGKDALARGDSDDACIHFRASLCMKPDDLSGMYHYAKMCREMYLESNDEEYIGRFKAEAMDYFELITEVHPQFAQGYYYLGYAYLNMGLYIKTKLTWEAFLRKSEDAKDRREIRERLQQLTGPVDIEHGYNAVLSGRYEEGLERLEAYMETSYKDWWPLSYYLGVCYSRTGQKKDAIMSFKRVLTMNASHLETMEELAGIYAADNDKENEWKYRKKIALIRKENENGGEGVREEID